MWNFPNSNSNFINGCGCPVKLIGRLHQTAADQQQTSSSSKSSSLLGGCWSKKEEDPRLIGISSIVSFVWRHRRIHLILFWRLIPPVRSCTFPFPRRRHVSYSWFLSVGWKSKSYTVVIEDEKGGGMVCLDGLPRWFASFPSLTSRLPRHPQQS